MSAAPVDGAAVLDQVRDFVSRFNAFPDEHCAPMLALWYAHTWAAEHFYITPRLVLSSAEPASGKTRVLEVAQFLVKAPEMTFSATSAALFRMVGAGPITILFDEVDAIFDTKGGGNEDLRALVNAGYKRSATVARCKGDAGNMVIERFPVYAPAALAGIAGRMPDTITTRAITVHMRRRKGDEKVEQFRERRVDEESTPIREALAAWMDAVGERVGAAYPEVPESVTDRSAEIWEPLLAIAEIAGGHWPETARAACTHFVSAAQTNPVSDRIRLLADLRGLFTDRGVTRMSTVEILAVLHSMDEAPWGDFHGKPLTARQLAAELNAYGVKVTTYKSSGKSFKGYVIDGETGLGDAWARYLPAEVKEVAP
ncbi:MULTISPECIES: DUF3631 domain-containing protein [Actinosynnema]|uniref:DUF3631 domain-containing protein n=1 Tax=Actinosynnema TaxID=40566 RepID=UPI0020A3447F|nr:DUF3631 domain-containing protein [Actinosynnema pretiosum]MCP2095196.1 Protein of unknown function (DUF3631) [Actinosynnema pretiosum]